MSDWKRQTREVTFESFPAEAASAIQKHIEQYNLGPILSDALVCVQTDSEKVKKGLFGKAETVRMAAIVTPRWLVWSMDQPKQNPVVLSAQLIHVTVQDYAQTPFVKMVPDSGSRSAGCLPMPARAPAHSLGWRRTQPGRGSGTS